MEGVFLNGKQVCKKLENEGWICKRIRGSHHIYGKEGRKPVPIPVHGKKDLGIGLLSKIEKETGVKLT
jgi:predicted RNA binding protein YcfA (HicA-like mRNA interferase family)